MARSKLTRAEFIQKHGEPAYLAYRASESAHKARTRARNRLRALGEAAPTDPIAMRRVMGGHPEDCDCYSCLFGENVPDDRPGCRVVRSFGMGV